MNDIFKTMQSTKENNLIWKENADEIKDKLNSIKNKYIKSIRVHQIDYLLYIRLDSLNKEDYPHNISENSIYLEFKVDLIDRKIELFRNGHIYLSEKDLKTERYKYYAMKSMTDCAVDYGVCKKFRKSKFKNFDDLINKMIVYYNNIMDAVVRYTGGYPYKNGIEK